MKDYIVALKHRILVLLLFFILILAFLISISIGRFYIDIPSIVKVISGHREGISKNMTSILLNVRIPRAIAALLVGAALSCSGATYQSLFHNPLASPNVLGAVSGAACGAAIGILLSFTDLQVQVIAFLAGILAVFLTYTISKIVGKGQSMVIFLLLVGMVVSALFTSVISITKYFADVDDELPAITFWLMGGLTNLQTKQLRVVAPIIIVGVFLLNFFRWKLNLISFGDDEAKGMGLDVKKVRLLMIGLSTLISSAAISLCGMVGWVGIVIPHCGRILVGANYKAMLPVTTLLGAIYLLLIDDLARNLLMIEIPLGILTALCGAPFFIYLLFYGNFLKQD